MIRTVTLALILLVLPMTCLADGQSGTQSPFAFGVGSRDLSMGGASTASCEAATAPFWNPARLTRAEQYTFSGFHSSLYESEMVYQYAGFVLPTLDLGTIGLGVSRLGIGGIERRDDGNLLLGTFDDTRLGVFLGYGKRLGAYDLGMTLSFEHHSLDSYSATSSPGLTLAVLRQFIPDSDWLQGFTLSAVARNLIKPGMKLDETTVNYPLALEFGMGLDIAPGASDDHRITLNARAEQVEDLDPSVSAGLEYDIYRLLKLRGGVRAGDLSFGAGLEYGALSFDYALVDRDLGSLHMFTLTTAFGKSVSRRRLEREREQETRFNTLMQDRLLASNRETVGRLIDEGRQLLTDENYREAENRFDRALFLARSSDADTTAIARLSDSTRQLLLDFDRRDRIAKNLTAAETQLQQRSYLQARYFAGLVLQDDTASARAARIVTIADSVLTASEAEERLLRDRLWAIDSLLSFGYVREAGQVAASIEEYAEMNAGVQVAIKRVEFERWREAASEAYVAQDLATALDALDSALIRFPAHQWCVETRTRLLNELETLARAKGQPTEPTPAPALALSEEMQREVETANRTAQTAFERGDLQQAIDGWERVLALAPNHRSVRSYLVNAYKFVGVDFYGQNRLREAVEVWRKAARLDPANEEIRQYITRTENEITRLNELSYDQ